MPSKNYLARIEDQRRRDKERQRRKLFTALRTGTIAPGPLTHTVMFAGQAVTISELEYLWLKVRGHIVENYNGTPSVTDAQHLRLHDTTTFNQKDYHHGT